VVDAWRWQTRGFDDELELLQVHTASHVVLNHIDAVDEPRATFVRETLQLVAPRAEVVTPEALEDIVLAVIQAGDAASRSLPAPTQRGSHARGHAFVSCQVPLPATSRSRHQIEQWLRALPDEVTRAKGIFRSTEGAFVVFQRFEGPAGFEVSFSPLSGPPAVEPCAVLIGVHLEAARLRTDTDRLLGVGEPLSH
jgi:G3E family GTPase